MKHKKGIVGNPCIKGIIPDAALAIGAEILFEAKRRKD